MPTTPRLRWRGPCKRWSCSSSPMSRACGSGGRSSRPSPWTRSKSSSGAASRPKAWPRSSGPARARSRPARAPRESATCNCSLTRSPAPRSSLLLCSARDQRPNEPIQPPAPLGARRPPGHRGVAGRVCPGRSHVRPGGRRGARRRGRRALPGLRRRDRGQRPRLQSSRGPRGGRARALHRADSCVQPLSHGAGRLGFLRELCASRGVALIFDEVQCGLGRTGTLFAYEQTGIVPDILTLAKPLAGGLPMGAVLVTGGIGASLKPGDHATTFGGGPLVARVALDVVRTVAAPDFLAAVRRKGDWVGERLGALAARSPRVREVRGRGLMWGIELTEPAAPFVTAARERALLVVTAGPNVLRLIPPLVITLEELERGVAILEEVLA